MLHIVIAAMSRDRIIGAGDAMPWQVPDEYRHFLASVRGQTMIMGRRSWEIFGGDVATAHNIVISRSASFPGVQVVPSLEAALALADSLGRMVFIAGGGSIYRQALDAGLVDEMHLSYIEGTFTGDTRFPAFDEADWVILERRRHAAWEFVRYGRR